MNLDEFIAWEKSSRDVIDVKRAYIDIAEDLVSGILLSQIVYWFLPTGKGASRLTITREGRQWLAKSRDEWWEECRITAKQFDRAAAMLEDKKFIVSRIFKFNGLSTKHVSLDMEKVFQGVKGLLTKGQKQLDCPKVNSGVDERLNAYIEAETTAKTTTENQEQPPSSKESFALVGEEISSPKQKPTAKESSDPRHAELRHIIFKLYSDHNRVLPAWSGREAKLLDSFLKSHSGWDFAKIYDCIENRFKSEENLALEPYAWIGKLANYAAGPLNEYGKPLNRSNGNGRPDKAEIRTETRRNNIADAIAERNRIKAGLDGAVSPQHQLKP